MSACIFKIENLVIFYAHAFTATETAIGPASCQWVEEKEARQSFPDLAAAQAACARLGEGHAVPVGALLREEGEAALSRGQRSTVTLPPARAWTPVRPTPARYWFAPQD